MSDPRTAPMIAFKFQSDMFYSLYKCRQLVCIFISNWSVMLLGFGKLRRSDLYYFILLFSP